MSKIIRQLEADEMLDDILKFQLETLAALLMVKKKHEAYYCDLVDEVENIRVYLMKAIDGEL